MGLNILRPGGDVVHSAELYALELSVLLFLVHVFTQSLLARIELGTTYMLGTRDEQRQVKGVFPRRAARALANFTENYVPFVAVDLGLIVSGRTGGFGAILWIAARILYFPFYLAGYSLARTIAWLASIIGLIMMLARLAGL